jgi:hypothetical protein
MDVGDGNFAGRPWRSSHRVLGRGVHNIHCVLWLAVDHRRHHRHHPHSAAPQKRPFRRASAGYSVCISGRRHAVAQFPCGLAGRDSAAGGSGWTLLGGVITLLLGILVWLHWPMAALWIIGLFIGINLLITGVSQIMLALALCRPAVEAA